MIVFVLALLIIDIISKILAKRYLTGTSIVIIKNFFKLTYAENKGAAWSMFDNNTVMVAIISGIIILGICYFLYKNKPKNKIEKVTYALVLAGAIGNFINRVIYGYVIDFIDIKIFNYNYPIFNLADVFIVIGIFWLIIDTWRGEHNAVRSRKW